MIRIVLGQRRTLWRDATAALLAQDPAFLVAGQVGCLDEAEEAARCAGADVVVLDVETLVMAEAEVLCEKLCAGSDYLKVLVLIERSAAACTGLCRLAPRVGLLATESSAAQLFEGIHRLAGGEPVLDPALAMAALNAGSNPLTDREREVLGKAVDGRPAKVIAAELFLSTGTVRNYMSRAITKTGAHSRFEAVRIARESGWI